MMQAAGTGIGGELARAREARGLALADVAQQLKFAARQLEALEQERFDLLPGGTFARGMVRSYARLLKLDPEPLVSRIGGTLDASNTGRLAERYREPVPFSDSARRSTLIYLGLSLLVLAAVGALAYEWARERAAQYIDYAPLAMGPVADIQRRRDVDSRCVKRLQARYRRNCGQCLISHASPPRVERGAGSLPATGV